MTNDNIYYQNRQPEIYMPQTIADVNQIFIWVAEGITNSNIFKRMENPFWRSDVDEFRGHVFCWTCHQEISLNYCHNCGQTLPKDAPSGALGVA